VDPALQRLGEVVDTSVATVPGSSTVNDALTSAGVVDWVVVTDEVGEPVGLVPGGQLLSAHPQWSGAPAEQRVADLVSSPVAVLPAWLNIAQSLQTWAVQELAAATTASEIFDVGIVVVDEGRPVGVLAGAPMAQYLNVWSSIDTQLGGGITSIGRVTHDCHYSEPGVDACKAIRSFSEMPDLMPDCDNPRKLTPHLFLW